MYEGRSCDVEMTMISNAGKHQRRDRIINHWLVIYWDQLFAQAHSHWIRRLQDASENNAFHLLTSLSSSTLVLGNGCGNKYYHSFVLKAHDIGFCILVFYRPAAFRKINYGRQSASQRIDF